MTATSGASSVILFGLFLWGWGLPDSSVGKESACNTGDPGSIPGLGRSPGEGIGYPFQYSWASLVAQLVKNVCNAGDLGSSLWGTLGMVGRPWSSSRLSCGERLLLRCDGNTGNSLPTIQCKDPSFRARRPKGTPLDLGGTLGLPLEWRRVCRGTS